jgi:hypothetical protein
MLDIEKHTYHVIAPVTFQMVDDGTKMAPQSKYPCHGIQSVICEGIWDFEAAAGYNQNQEDEIAKKDKMIK